ncbi:hypothetical protein D3C87_1858380 [compost metagenome]
MPVVVKAGERPDVAEISGRALGCSSRVDTLEDCAGREGFVLRMGRTTRGGWKPGRQNSQGSHATRRDEDLFDPPVKQ